MNSGTRRTKGLCLTVMTLVLIMVIAAPGFGGRKKERTHYADRGFYLSLAGTRTDLGGGNFDGDKVASANGFLFQIPSLDVTTGGRAVFGIRLDGGSESMDFGTEFIVLWSNHDGRFAYTAGRDVTFVNLGLDAKVFFGHRSRIQPSLQAGGIFFSILNIEDAAFDPYLIEAGDASLFGMGLDVGADINFFLTPQVTLFAGGSVRPTFYMDADGPGEDGSEELDDTFGGTAWDVHVGMAVTIPISSFNE